ncbi:MAG TPA: universal stress protein, partial [Candidatus Acidoferrales bacterium]|nr:universal stress protein [Candidatus Acidoferrales bacterium]
ILVATDFSNASSKALRYAVSLARHHGAKVYLIHVVSSLGLTVTGPDAIVHASWLAAREIEAVRESLLRGGVLDGISFEPLVSAGDIWVELEKVIRHEQIDLLVLGTHSRTGIAKMALGSVAERIFRNASCPVLSVGPYSPSETRAGLTTEPRILFPTDFGEKSLRPLPYALWLAKQRRARLVVFHALSTISRPESTLLHRADAVADIQADAKASCLDRLRTLIPASSLELEPLYVADFGEPMESILRAAKEYRTEAIVMGLVHTKYIDALAHMPGTITYDVVRKAQCPVLTVRR